MCGVHTKSFHHRVCLDPTNLLLIKTAPYKVSAHTNVMRLPGTRVWSYTRARRISVRSRVGCPIRQSDKHPVFPSVGLHAIRFAQRSPSEFAASRKARRPEVMN